MCHPCIPYIYLYITLETHIYGGADETNEGDFCNAVAVHVGSIRAADRCAVRALGRALLAGDSELAARNSNDLLELETQFRKKCASPAQSLHNSVLGSFPT